MDRSYDPLKRAIEIDRAQRKSREDTKELANMTEDLMVILKDKADAKTVTRSVEYCRTVIFELVFNSKELYEALSEYNNAKRHFYDKVKELGFSEAPFGALYEKLERFRNAR